MTVQEWCLQYNEWVNIYEGKSTSILNINGDSEWNDHTVTQAQALMCIRIVDECCRLAAGDRWEDLLLSMTEDIPHSVLGVSSHEVQSFLVFLSRKIHFL